MVRDKSPLHTRQSGHHLQGKKKYPPTISNNPITHERTLFARRKKHTPSAIRHALAAADAENSQSASASNNVAERPQQKQNARPATASAPRSHTSTASSRAKDRPATAGRRRPRNAPEPAHRAGLPTAREDPDATSAENPMARKGGESKGYKYPSGRDEDVAERPHAAKYDIDAILDRTSAEVKRQTKTRMAIRAKEETRREIKPAHGRSQNPKRVKPALLEKDKAHVWNLKPFVNVFDYWKIQQWKTSEKRGDVTVVLDRQIRKNAYRIWGSVPAANCMQLPKSKSQSLGLTGRYIYAQIRIIPGRIFLLHFDLVTEHNLVVRVNLSNLYKDIKVGGNVVNFPCHGFGKKWMVIALDAQAIVQQYTGRQYQALKQAKFCACMFVRGLVTSDQKFTPKSFPRDVNYIVPATESWGALYDWHWFPTASAIEHPNPYHSAEIVPAGLGPSTSPVRRSYDLAGYDNSRTHQHSLASSVVTREMELDRIRSGGPGSPGKRRSGDPVTSGPSANVGVIDSLNGEPVRGAPGPAIPAHMPVPLSHQAVATTSSPTRSPSRSPVRRSPTRRSPSKQQQQQQQRAKSPVKSHADAAIPSTDADTMIASAADRLSPDPIMTLGRIVGFTGRYNGTLTWSPDASSLIYSSSSIVTVQSTSGQQRHLLGHTGEISVVALSANGRVLVTGQAGRVPVIRVWNFATGECRAILKAHHSSLSSIAINEYGTRMVAVGLDSHGRQLIVLWNISPLENEEGRVEVIAKQVSDFEITKAAFPPLEEEDFMTIGTNNIKFWRLKSGQLRSGSLNLGAHFKHTFTDIAYESNPINPSVNTGRRAFVSTTSGMVFQCNVTHRILECVFHLHNAAINSLAVNEGFCVTGSADKFIRVWPLDFSDYFMEAEHEDAVTSVSLTADCLKVAVGTANGTIGVLDVATHDYQTLMRSHTGGITALALDPHHREFATVSTDTTIRVWDLDSYDQLFEFDAPGQVARCITYHPHRYVLAVGFDNGSLRIFDIASTSLIEEYQQHKGAVLDVIYSRDGAYVYTAGQDGSICMFDAANHYLPTKMLATPGPTTQVSMALSVDGNWLAATGPDALSVIIFNAATLEVSRKIDSGNNPVRHVRFSPDGKEIVASTFSKKLLRLRIADGTIVKDMPQAHGDTITDCLVSHDGKFIVTSSEDHQVRVWPYHLRRPLSPTGDAQPYQSFVGHLGAVNAITMTPDNRTILSAGDDGGIYMWSFIGHAAPVGHEVATVSSKADSSAGPGGKAVPGSVGFIRQLYTLDQLEQRVSSLPSSHFLPRAPPVALAEKRYVAAPGEAGLALVSALGYNGDGSNNVIWVPESALFVYPVGCLVVMEGLDSRQQHVLQGHSDHISTLTVSSAGTHIASASGYATDSFGSRIFIWDVATGAATHILTHHERGVQTLAFSGNDAMLVSCGGYLDLSLAVWDVVTGQLLADCVLPSVVNIVRWVPGCNEFVTGGEQRSVMFWSVNDTNTLTVSEARWEAPTMNEEPFHVTAIDFDLEAHMVLASSNGLISFWSLENKQILSTCASLSGSEITAVSWRGDTIVTGGADANLEIWPVTASDDLRDPFPLGGHIATPPLLDGSVSSLVLDDTGTDGIVSTSTGTIFYLSLANQTVARLVSSHCNDIGGVTFAHDNATLASAGHEGSVRLWDTVRAHELKQFQVYDDVQCTTIATPASDEQLVAAGYSDGSVKVFHILTGSVQHRCKPHDSPITALVFASDDQVIVSATSDGHIAFTRRATGSTYRRVDDLVGSSISSLDTSPFTPSLLLASTRDCRVSVFTVSWASNVVDTVCAFRAEGSEAEAAAKLDMPSLATFSRTEQHIVCFTFPSDTRNQLRFFDFVLKKPVRSLPLMQPATSLALSPSGDLVVVGTDDRLVKLIDYEEGTFQDFVGHIGPVTSVAISPAGDRVVSASRDEILVWSVAPDPA